MYVLLFVLTLYSYTFLLCYKRNYLCGRCVAGSYDVTVVWSVASRPRQSAARQTHIVNLPHKVCYTVQWVSVTSFQADCHLVSLS